MANVGEGMEPELQVRTVDPLAGQVQLALEGGVFPLAREDLIAIARENEAPRMLVTLLAGLPDGAYESAEQVCQRVEGRSTPVPVKPS